MAGPGFYKLFNQHHYSSYDADERAARVRHFQHPPQRTQGIAFGHLLDLVCALAEQWGYPGHSPGVDDHIQGNDRQGIVGEPVQFAPAHPEFRQAGGVLPDELPLV